MNETTNRDAWMTLWREMWRPARWGLIFLSYAAVLRVGWHLGVASAA